MTSEADCKLVVEMLGWRTEESEKDTWDQFSPSNFVNLCHKQLLPLRLKIMLCLCQASHLREKEFSNILKMPNIKPGESFSLVRTSKSSCQSRHNYFEEQSCHIITNIFSQQQGKFFLTIQREQGGFLLGLFKRPQIRGIINYYSCNNLSCHPSNCAHLPFFVFYGFKCDAFCDLTSFP